MRALLLLSVAAVLAYGASGVLAQLAPQPYATAADADFTVMALVTADPGWKAQWNRTDGQAPQLVPSPHVEVGDTAQVLVMFGGAAERDGRATLTCTVTLTLPDGGAQQLGPTKCFDRPLDGPPEAVRMLDIDMGVHVEATDPPGLYTFAIEVTDAIRPRSASVVVSVEVGAGGRV